MVHAPSLRTGLLDLAAGIGFAGPMLMVLYTYDTRDGRVSALVVALIACELGVWVLWRRSGQRSRILAAVFAVLAAVTMMFGNGALFYGIIWAASLVLSVTFAPPLVLWGYAAALTVLTFALHLSSGSAAEILLAETAGTAVLSGIAAAVGGVLRDSLRVGDALNDTLRDLDRANEELRRRLGTERELVLAMERERLARELHDDMGHRLTALGLSIDYAGRIGDPDAARNELVRARDLVGDSLASMRSLVRAMHPVPLGELRDAEALRAVADAFSDSGLDVRVSVSGAHDPLPHDAALLLLRFAQEGLTNVVRHAAASRAQLTVAVDADRISAALTDTGRCGEGAVREGFGLRSLRERASELGGDLEATRSASGFRLAVAVPRGPAAGAAPADRAGTAS